MTLEDFEKMAKDSWERIEQGKRALIEAQEHYNRQNEAAAGTLASATDLLNTWAREWGVEEARTEDRIKDVIERLWVRAATYRFIQGGAND